MPTRSAASMNWLFRQLLRLGNWCFKAYCYVVRPNRRGAYIAVWWDERILLVENSYRTEVTLPCGAINSNETPVAGAKRELEEEVGLAIDTERFKLAARFMLDHDNMRDEVFLFELEFTARPVIKIDNREVVKARFAKLEDARMLRLSAVAAHVLDLYARRPGVPLMDVPIA